MFDTLQPMDCSTTRFPVHHHFPELTQTHAHQVSDTIQTSHHLPSHSPAFSLSQHQVLIQWVSSSQEVAKVLEFQFQYQSFQWIFRTDFLWDWLLWSPYSLRDSQESSPIPQIKTINPSVLRFLYSLTLTSLYDYWKTTALTRCNFVSKVMSLLFNVLFRLVVAFLPRSKRLLISWLQSPQAVILEPPKIMFSQFSHCFHCFAMYLPWSDGTRYHDLHFLNVEF